MERRLIVEKSECLLTDEVAIQVEDLNRYEIVEIHVEMTDNFGELWSSWAMVQANLFGEIDLAKALPLLGSYSVPSKMGLFWSMTQETHVRDVKKSPLKPLKTTITLKRNGAAEEVLLITRHVVHPALIREEVMEAGLAGTFFHHGGKKIRPTLLVLGSSEGGVTEAQAALLAEKGFNVLALAYFQIGGLSSRLIEIPIDYFRKAIMWLQEEPYVDISRLAVVGTLMGAEHALWLASEERNIKAVVAYIPSTVIHMGLECTAIPVEKINGPILIISGGDNQVSSSNQFGVHIMERLKVNRFKHKYEHLCYPKVEHVVGCPGMPTTDSTNNRYASTILGAGGTPEENYKAQADSWEKVISFLKQSL